MQNLLKACSFPIRTSIASTFHNESKRGGMEPTATFVAKRF
jgi:hypothetical protein